MSYLSDGGHVMIIGVTGAGAESTPYGGKSVLANWWHDNAIEYGWFDLSIYFNAKPTQGIRGHRVESVNGLAQAYENGHRKINYIPSNSEHEHAQITAGLGDVPGSKLFISDEPQNYPDSLVKAVKEGSGSQTKNLLVMQRGWDVHESIRSQVVWDIWIGPYSEKYEGYFDQELTDAAKHHIRENHEPYQWSVFDAAGELVEWNNPVPKAYA